MAKKITPNTPANSSVSKTPAPTTSPVRNTSIPKAQPKTITREMIAMRAYEISQSPQCGSEFDNWVRAERELKGM
jgi:hypothetical protein